MSSNATIIIYDDGPIEVTGAVNLKDENGSNIATDGGDSFFLCRCGASEEKPFCDGNHHSCGFAHKASG